ncbi:MAG: hypothetical protein SF052_09295 [Bacteroidia bacterium]|nr:hypothetical protein [Bacteroidia bacterium]
MKTLVKSVTVVCTLLVCALFFQGNTPPASDNSFGEVVVDENYIPVGILGCDITIKAENKSLKKITIQFEESDVKTQTGTWSNIYFGTFNNERCDKANLILESKSGIESNRCELDMGCNFERRYRFKLKSVYEGETSYATVYFPSSTGYANEGTTVIDLGNIGRHFK